MAIYINQLSVDLLQGYYFSGNIPVILIQSDVEADISVSLSAGGNPFLIDITELHTPDWGGTGLFGIIYLNISDLISAHLKTSYPLDQSLEELGFVGQTGAFGTVTIKVDGDTVRSFKVIKGVVDYMIPEYESPLNFQTYIKKNILSLCPQIRLVKPDHPNALTYYAVGGGKVYINAKIFTGYDGQGNPQHINEEKTYYTFIGESLYTFDAMYQSLSALYSLSEGQHIEHIDVYGKDNDSSIQTASIRLIPDNTVYPYDDLFAFENSLGGIDIIRFTGVLSESIEHEYLSQTNIGRTSTYGLVHITIYSKNTGYFPDEEHAIFANDFIASTNIYHYKNERFEPIVITEKEAIYTKGKISAFSFKFKYSHQHTGKLLNRNTEL